MTPTFLSAIHRLVLSNVPHAHELLDAINPRGTLRVLDVKLDRPREHVLQSEICVAGLDATEAELWAATHSDGPLLRVHTPLRGGRAGTLWLGRIRFDQTPRAYVCFELPVATHPNPNQRDSFVTLTTCRDPSVIDAWAADERARLAEKCVERTLRPVIQQAEQFGFEAIALGLRAALRALPPEQSSGLFGCTVPVLFTGWIECWAQALALRAPCLKRIEAGLAMEPQEKDAFRLQPLVLRLRLTGSAGEPLCIHTDEDESYWEEDEHAAELARLRAVTGMPLETPEAVVSFLEELAALMLMQYRANGATEIDMPQTSTTPPQ